VHAHGVGRRGGFKADAEEDHLLVRILDGEFDGVQRRIDDAHVAAAALDLEQVASVPGTRSMSPKEQKMTPGCAAMASALSISSSGVTQTGQPGP
jgi:hypothetical protein